MRSCSLIRILRVCVLVSVLWLLSCRSCPRPGTQTVVVDRQVACLTVAPPELQPWTVEGPESLCPTRYAVCLTAASAAALTVNTERMVDWIRDAWSRCAPSPVAPETQP